MKTDASDHDQQIARELLGSVSARSFKKATGGHTVDKAILAQKKAADPDCTLVVFCAGCGQYLCLSKEGASRLAKEKSNDLIASAGYLQVNRCLACSDDFEEIFSKPLP